MRQRPRRRSDQRPLRWCRNYIPSALGFLERPRCSADTTSAGVRAPPKAGWGTASSPRSDAQYARRRSPAPRHPTAEPLHWRDGPHAATDRLRRPREIGRRRSASWTEAAWLVSGETAHSVAAHETPLLQRSSGHSSSRQRRWRKRLHQRYVHVVTHRVRPWRWQCGRHRGALASHDDGRSRTAPRPR